MGNVSSVLLPKQYSPIGVSNQYGENTNNILLNKNNNNVEFTI